MRNALIDEEEADSEVSEGGATRGLKLSCLHLLGDHGCERWHSVLRHRKSHTCVENIIRDLDIIIIGIISGLLIFPTPTDLVTVRVVHIVSRVITRARPPP